MAPFKQRTAEPASTTSDPPLCPQSPAAQRPLSSSFSVFLCALAQLSVQENILMGLPMRRQWYDRVLSASELRPDLSLLPSGDQTEIGKHASTHTAAGCSLVVFGRSIGRSVGRSVGQSVLHRVPSSACLVLCAGGGPQLDVALVSFAVGGLATHQASGASICPVARSRGCRSHALPTAATTQSSSCSTTRSQPVDGLSPRAVNHPSGVRCLRGSLPPPAPMHLVCVSWALTRRGSQRLTQIVRRDG